MVSLGALLERVAVAPQPFRVLQDGPPGDLGYGQAAGDTDVRFRQQETEESIWSSRAAKNSS
jgi:hypothetical protein